MHKRQMGLGWRVQRLLTRGKRCPQQSLKRGPKRECHRWRSQRVRQAILTTLLFVLSVAVSPVIAKVPDSIPIIHTSLPPLTKAELGGVASNRVEQGKTLYQAGRFEEAATAWQQAASRFATQGDTLNQAMALSNLSLTYQQLGEWEQAKDAIVQSLTLVKNQESTPNQLRILAQSLDIQGQLQLAVGELEDAIESWQEATDIYTQIGNKEGIIQSQINQAQALQDLGLYPRACKTLLTALELDNIDCQISDEELQTLTTQPASSLKVLGLRSLGNVLRVIGSSEESQKVLEVSLQFAQQLGEPQSIAAVYLSLGNTARILSNREILKPSQRNEYKQAGLNYYNQAVELATSSTTQLQAQLNLLSLLIESENWSEASSLLPSIKSQLNSLPISRAGVYAQINLAQNLMKMGRWGERSAPLQNKQINQSPPYSLTVQEIDQILLTASEQAKRLGEQRAEAYALGNRGRLYEINQQWKIAENFTKQALNLAPSYTSQDIAYQFFWQLGRIGKAQGDKKEAIASYTKAVDTLQSLRSDLVAISSDVQFSFRESVEPVYRQLVELLLQAENGSQPSQEHLTQARQAIEYLQLAELDNFFREACTSVNPVQIDQVDRNTGVIYSVILPQELDVILSLPGQPLRHHSIPISQNELENTLTRLRRAIALDDIPNRSRATIAVEWANNSPNADFLPPAQQIYDWLIRWAEPDLASNEVQTLVFVLDGVLRNIPMAVLHDGKQYLVEKYSLALTPGLQLLDPKPLAREQLRMLTVGLSEERQGFAPLPNVKLEVEQIEAEVPSQVLLNQSFTTPNFKATVNSFPFPVVHIATHGQFSSVAEDTFILTWDDRVNADELNSLLRAEPRQTRPIELLVLSACQTAVGDNRAALGLAGVAVRAGARSTAASLWLVSDEATAKLMTRFYREFANNKVTKAEALRHAQLEILQDAQFSHPYFWAPFVLVGNWL